MGDHNPQASATCNALLVGVFVCALVLFASLVIIFVIQPTKKENHKIGRYFGAYYGSDQCGSGKIFVGSVSDKFPQHQRCTGIFVQQGNITTDGRPMYKHETRAVNLYHTATGYWVIRPKNGEILIRAKSNAYRPNEAIWTWSIRVNGSKKWTDQPYMKATCVDKSFRLCLGDIIEISVRSQWVHLHHRLLGAYKLNNSVVNGRPVYQSVSDITQYMFYARDGLWVVSVKGQRSNYAMKVSDYAVRPEYIAQSWHLLYKERKTYYRSEYLKVTCIDKRPDQPVLNIAKDDASCSGKRIFVGSVSDEFPDQKRKTGIFLRSRSVANGRPVYRHESIDAYLYHTPEGFWVVAENSTFPGMRVRSQAHRPEKAFGVWEARVNSSDNWVKQELLTAVCINKTFVTCPTVKIKLNTLSTLFALQHLLGAFSLLEELSFDRPVYRNYMYRNVYLFHREGLWVAGEWCHQPYMNACQKFIVYTRDFATRADHIIHAWTLSLYARDFHDIPITLECVDYDPSRKPVAWSPRKFVDGPNCHSGVMFLGSIRNLASRKQYLVGSYVEDKNSTSLWPRFKHTTSPNYLYHVQEEGYWVVGVPGRPYVMRVRNTAHRPDVVSQLWSMRHDLIRTAFVEETLLGAFCVKEIVHNCPKHCNVRLSGLPTSIFEQRKLMGEYSLNNDAKGWRQTYAHVLNNEPLYYSAGMWVVGRRTPEGGHRLYSRDYASSPVYIMHPWKAYSDTGYQVVRSIQVSCVNND